MKSLLFLGKTVRSVTSDTPLALNMSRSTSGIPSEYGANCDDTHSPIDSQVSMGGRKGWREEREAGREGGREGYTPGIKYVPPHKWYTV